MFAFSVLVYGLTAAIQAACVAPDVLKGDDDSNVAR